MSTLQRCVGPVHFPVPGMIKNNNNKLACESALLAVDREGAVPETKGAYPSNRTDRGGKDKP